MQMCWHYGHAHVHAHTHALHMHTASIEDAAAQLTTVQDRVVVRDGRTDLLVQLDALNRAEAPKLRADGAKGGKARSEGAFDEQQPLPLLRGRGQFERVKHVRRGMSIWNECSPPVRIWMSRACVVGVPPQQ